MKKGIWVLLMTVAINLHADDAAPTNSPPPHMHGAKGDAAKDEKGEAPKNEAATMPDATHKPVFTTNTVTIAGESVKYVAETGMLPILKPDGTTIASVFYIAYTRLDKTNTATRPVTFAFNGGSRLFVSLAASRCAWPAPGEDESRRHAAATTIRIGGIMSIPSLGRATWCSLIRWRPGSAGRRKMKRPSSFFGVRGDLDSVGGFIRLWTTRHDRWLSPKFLCGESYGTFRAAGLADYLSSHDGMYLNGVYPRIRPAGLGHNR